MVRGCAVVWAGLEILQKLRTWLDFLQECSGMYSVSVGAEGCGYGFCMSGRVWLQRKCYNPTKHFLFSTETAVCFGYAVFYMF